MFVEHVERVERHTSITLRIRSGAHGSVGAAEARRFPVAAFAFGEFSTGYYLAGVQPATRGRYDDSLSSAVYGAGAAPEVIPIRDNPDWMTSDRSKTATPRMSSSTPRFGAPPVGMTPLAFRWS